MCLGKDENMDIKVNLENTGIDKKEIMKYKEQVENIHKDLHSRSDKEDDLVGWLDLPTNYDKKEFKRIQTAAKRINKDSDILLVIGIYLYRNYKGQNVLVIIPK